MSFEISVTVVKVGDVERFGSFDTEKRVLRGSTGGQHPQVLDFDFLKDRMGALTQFKEGDIVTVAFWVRGREHNGRAFISLRGIDVRPYARKEGANDQLS